MSVYRFEYIIKNIDYLLFERRQPFKDSISLEHWVDYGFVGWDEKHSCYYVFLAMGDDEHEDILHNDRGIILKSSTGIYTFEQLCDTINDIFGVFPDTFEFENNIEITQQSKVHTNTLKSQPGTDYLKIIIMILKGTFDACKFIVKWIGLILLHILFFFYEAYIDSQWKKLKSKNYCNQHIGATIYKWGDHWNMVINDVHYKHYPSVQSAKDDALLKWREG